MGNMDYLIIRIKSILNLASLALQDDPPDKLNLQASEQNLANLLSDLNKHSNIPTATIDVVEVKLSEVKKCLKSLE